MRPLIWGRPSTVPSFFCHLLGSTPQRNPAASPSESPFFSPSHPALRLWLHPLMKSIFIKAPSGARSPNTVDIFCLHLPWPGRGSCTSQVALPSGTCFLGFLDTGPTSPYPPDAVCTIPLGRWLPPSSELYMLHLSLCSSPFLSSPSTLVPQVNRVHAHGSTHLLCNWWLPDVYL